jgi:hypothetical protein|tara:strand:- start:10883 stop:11644 length:762 start_codon:yes stop_codon:yes gene_type:complete
MKLVICLVLVLSLSPVGLIGQIVVSYQYNIDVYKPYTSLAQDYMKLKRPIESRTQSLFASYPILKTGNSTFRFGLNYKRVDHSVKNRVLYIPVYKIGSHQYSFVGNYPGQADLISRSNYFGLHLDYNRMIVDKGNYKGSAGVNSELYLVEYFKSEYIFGTIDVSGAPFPNEYSSYMPLTPLNAKERNFFNPSLSTFSIYYLNTFQLAQKFSLGLRVSLGTNLYSKWDQFSRYAWVGLGLELGFGRYEVKQPVE